MVQNLEIVVESEVINFLSEKLQSLKKRWVGCDDGIKLSDHDMLEEIEKYACGETTELGERLYMAAEELY